MLLLAPLAHVAPPVVLSLSGFDPGMVVSLEPRSEDCGSVCPASATLLRTPKIAMDVHLPISAPKML
jgi:hypothetical protein